MDKSTVVVGGGASGILSAVIAARKGEQVTLLEKSDRIGKKLLATGNGKCNLTNVNCSVADYNTPFVRSVIEKYPPEKVIDFFSSLGLLTRVDEEGRVYPYSESATTVLNVLMQNLKREGVRTVTECEVSDIRKKDDKWIVRTDKGEYSGDKVIVATGSDATSGSKSYSLLAPLGHYSTPIDYAIAPLLCKDIKGANGVRAKVFAEIEIDGKKVMGERGEMLFKDNALSGVLAFRLSSALARTKKKFSSCKVIIDFVPDCTPDELQKRILDYDNPFNPLEGILHKALALNVTSRTPMDKSLLMSPAKAAALAKTCKRFEVEVTGVAGRQFAQVASGGVETDGFDPETLQSLKHEGLYCVGEILDVDGLCGGYNLQWAWASAMAAGGLDDKA